MISTTKLSARTVLRAIKAAFRLYQSKASQGKQSVRTLLRQNRGVSSISALKNIRKYIDMVLNKQQLSAPGGKTPEKESVLKKLNDSKAALEQKKSQTQPKESEHTL
ncbi:DUF3801 domain-containing protein [Faecalibacterium sp. AF27-11BH]|jgi:hypothetical protein|uniref:DUF3801 domain-containing protein n=1 Tax=Faecalibacterium sp. AF27-11BH TaxID=2302956 RepID=UPI000E70B0AB|nr:DUF3801 domain-containing protein [Faecalibacterium sp. AF27-11BH]RJV78044.1 hypothetical protein DWY76_05025 [Faecalibacterium sp. AF27-11BH]